MIRNAKRRIPEQAHLQSITKFPGGKTPAL